MENLQRNSSYNSIKEKPWFFSPFFIIAAVGLVLSVLGIIAMVYYSSSFLHFKTLAKLSYESSKAKNLLSDSQSIVFTRDNEIYVSNLKGKELLLVPQLKQLGQKMASFKISKSRNYITWESEKGLLALNVPKREVFLIYSGEPRQSYDLSPLDDTILFVTKSELLEVSLANGYRRKVLSSLPKLGNPKFHFNHVKYAPNGKLAYIRSIHLHTEKTLHGDPEHAVINFDTEKISFIKEEFSPAIWSPDSTKLLGSRDQDLRWKDKAGLVEYDINAQRLSVLIPLEEYRVLGAYDIDASGKTLVYVTSKDPPLILDKSLPQKMFFTNYKIFLFSLNTKTHTTLIDRKLHLDNTQDAIEDAGWLDSSRVWFMLGNTRYERDMWIVDTNGGAPQKVLKGIIQYSLENNLNALQILEMQ